ncbi:hypothetical protein [Aquipuribacter sp. SD81]|uniref:hypothetical protein n=1 Tax=Aquipuribacter sp. SD81 TaxID=3127703 RepID=UPI003019A97B
MTTATGTPGKRDFTALYTAPDPRPYFSYFRTLEYGVVGTGARLFRRLVEALADGEGGPGAPGDDASVVADVCCSYGQDAALLNHDLDEDELFSHWADPATADLDRDALVRRDREFFATRRRPDAVTVLGLDASAPAVEYGLAAGLLDGGVAADTEADPDVDLSVLAPVTGAVVTGGVGYVGARTFARVVDAADEQPWVCGLVLRWVDLRPVATELEQRGYTVQVADGCPVTQRRMFDDERPAVLAGLDALGRRPGVLEERGYHAAVPFLATPRSMRALPLERLAAGLEHA